MKCAILNLYLQKKICMEIFSCTKISKIWNKNSFVSTVVFQSIWNYFSKLLWCNFGNINNFIWLMQRKT